MAIKFQGSQATGASYRIGSGIPLDERLVVSFYSDLFNSNTFLFVNKQNQTTSTQTAYPGMVVAVIEDTDPSKNGLYLLTSLPSTTESNWKKVGSDFNPEDINAGIQELMISCTFSELMSLIALQQLIPGAKYRLTDYKATADKVYKCKEHQFDIILTASTTNNLNINASACKHINDTYFHKPERWELKFVWNINDLNSDNVRKFYYNEENVSDFKGAIIYMKDEFNNEAMFDFKNICRSDGKYLFNLERNDESGNKINVDASLNIPADKKDERGMTVYNNSIMCSDDMEYVKGYPYYAFTTQRDPFQALFSNDLAHGNRMDIVNVKIENGSSAIEFHNTSLINVTVESGCWDISIGQYQVDNSLYLMTNTTFKSGVSGLYLNYDFDYFSRYNMENEISFSGSPDFHHHSTKLIVMPGAYENVYFDEDSFKKLMYDDLVKSGHSNGRIEDEIAYILTKEGLYDYNAHYHILSLSDIYGEHIKLTTPSLYNYDNAISIVELGLN